VKIQANMKIPNTNRTYYIITAIILFVGLGSAALIFTKAEVVSDNVSGYGMENGTVYQISPEDTKMYSRNMEMYGGKANVLVDEFRHWFIGLWQGQALAYTIACITVIISLGLLFAANHLPHDQDSDTQDKNNDD
jgi:ABC-type phosphate/phosphonate transport system permease subunit